MPVWPSDYIENVVNDVERYRDTIKPVKAGLVERCAIRYCSPKKLHPNPQDEFSQPSIGPNMQIVGNYVEEIKHNLKFSLPIYKEPVIVQKMQPEGYLLLNGHHRWFAAIRMGISKLHVHIVNLINEVDITRMMGETDNTKLVTFDFDEVLLSADANNQAPIQDELFSRKITERLRTGAPEVIKTFQDRGYDICVYSAGYFSEDDFNDFFSMYELNVNIIVNGINEKRNRTTSSSERLKELLRDKYKLIAHVDDNLVVATNHVTKDYVVYEIENFSKEWYEGVKKVVETSTL